MHDRRIVGVVDLQRVAHRDVRHDRVVRRQPLVEEGDPGLGPPARLRERRHDLGDPGRAGAGHRRRQSVEHGALGPVYGGTRQRVEAAIDDVRRQLLDRVAHAMMSG